MNKILKTNYITLLDIFEADKVYNKELIKIVLGKNNFSIKHGSIPQETKSKLKKKKIKFNKSMIFAFSKNEINYYRDIYGVNLDQIKVFGNPKHDKDWINYIINNDKIKEFKKKYIFVISRPVTDYLPIDKKIKFLNMIKIVAKQYDYKVIIKLHPKEKLDKIFVDVFGESEHNKSWEISNKHPLVLGKYCEFAVSFFRSSN